MMNHHNCSCPQHHNKVHTSSNDKRLPVAKAICFDFHCNERVGWEVSTTGIVRPIAYAVAANVDTPKGFPKIPETQDERVQESAEGLYEVANVLERCCSLHDPTFYPAAHAAYREALQEMTDKLSALYNNEDEEKKNLAIDDSMSVVDSKNMNRRVAIISICEYTNYQLEAIIGLIQVFVDTSSFHNIHGVERVGVYSTFTHYTYDQNYKFNLSMAQWLRDHWTMPFADLNEVYRLSFSSGFEPMLIHSWLQNAITVVWNPLLTCAGALRKYRDELLFEHLQRQRTKRGAQFSSSGNKTMLVPSPVETLATGFTPPRRQHSVSHVVN